MKVTIEHDNQQPAVSSPQPQSITAAGDPQATNGGQAPGASAPGGLTLASSAVSSSTANSGGAPSDDLLAAIAAAASSTPISINSPDAINGGTAPAA
jgi:hypothetical protein